MTGVSKFDDSFLADTKGMLEVRFKIWDVRWELIGNNSNKAFIHGAENR
jgi:hypothetical protein